MLLIKNQVNNQRQNSLYSGTSGLVLPVPNKQSYPPQFQDKPRLAYYASLFNSIEINSSFYKVPQAATVGKWADSVPDGFRFAFKLWRDITHNKGLAYEPAAIDRFMTIINAAGDKKGSLLIQFPPGIKTDSMAKVKGLLELIRLADIEKSWDTAVEFRHPSWYHEKTYHLLDGYQMGLVLHDLPASATPLMETEVDFVYLRFHGPNGGYRGSYPDDYLREFAEYINDWRGDGKTVYAYFNNTMGEAVQNLNTLNGFANTLSG